MVIRRAVPKDAASISRLAAEVQQIHHDEDPESYKPPAPETTEAWFHDLLTSPDTVAFIAEGSDQSAIGYVVTFPSSTDGNAVRYRAEFVELNQIGVANRCRGQGVGRALHDRVVAHWTSAGATEIRLTVMAFNAGARQYYERLGFVESSRRMLLRLEP